MNLQWFAQGNVGVFDPVSACRDAMVRRKTRYFAGLNRVDPEWHPECWKCEAAEFALVAFDLCCAVLDDPMVDASGTARWHRHGVTLARTGEELQVWPNHPMHPGKNYKPWKRQVTRLVVEGLRCDPHLLHYSNQVNTHSHP